MTSALPPFLASSVDDTGHSMTNHSLENDGFCPEIKLQDFIDRYQVSDDYSTERRLQCLREAMRQINAEIKAVIKYWIQEGCQFLTELGNDMTNAYHDAVFCFALKLLAERYRNTNTTQSASAKATEYAGQIDYWNGEYIRHVHYLLGNTGATIEAVLV